MSSNVVQVFCEWRIENFSFYDGNSLLLSPGFSVGILNNTKWGLHVWKKTGVHKKNKKNLVCFLKRYRDDGPRSVELFYEISVVSTDGSLKQKHATPIIRSFTKNSCGRQIILLESENYTECIMSILNNDTLTVCCRMWREGTKNSIQCSIRTPIKVQTRRLKWVLENINSIQDVEYQLKYSNEDSSPFELSLYWCCFSDYSDETIQVAIAQSEPYRRQHITCKISVVDHKGNLADSMQGQYDFEGNVAEFWSFPPFIMKSWLMDSKDLYLPNGTLTLQLEMKISDNSSNEIDLINFGEFSDTNSISSMENNVSDDQRLTSTASNSLMSGLLDLYKDRKFCDVILEAENASFPVHKAILCAQSPVFAAMFERDLEEKQTGVARISNMSDDTVEQMLMFMYTNKVEDLRWENALNLYFASDEYDILQLKLMCQAFLKANLSISNVTEALVLADLHRDENLKSASHDFILEHDREVIDSDQWNQFMQEHLNLAAETTHLLYRRKLQK